MNKIDVHINRLFQDIPDSGRKDEIIEEIKQNLSEKVADLVSQGQTEDEAVKKAIDDFGDIGDIKEELVSSVQLSQSRNLGLLLAFSIWGGILITALFIFINFYYTPQNIWCVYPIFGVIWWPMSIFFHWLHKRTGRGMGFPYSVASFALITVLLLFINLYYTPGIIWFVYPTFGVIWWPMVMFFLRLRQKNRKDDRCENER
jgi:hypothetical protein